MSDPAEKMSDGYCLNCRGHGCWQCDASKPLSWECEQRAILAINDGRLADANVLRAAARTISTPPSVDERQRAIEEAAKVLEAIAGTPNLSQPPRHYAASCALHEGAAAIRALSSAPKAGK